MTVKVISIFSMKYHKIRVKVLRGFATYIEGRYVRRITPLMRAHMDLHHILCLGRHEFRVHEDLNIMDH